MLLFVTYKTSPTLFIVIVKKTLRVASLTFKRMVCDMELNCTTNCGLPSSRSGSWAPCRLPVYWREDLHMRSNISHYSWLQWLVPITWSETSWFETHVAYHSLDGRPQIRVNIILLYQATKISANVMKRDMVSPGSLCVTLTTPGTFIYCATDVNTIPCANDAQCHVRRGRNVNVRHWRRCWADYVNDADVNAEILRRERLRVICLCRGSTPAEQNLVAGRAPMLQGC